VAATQAALTRARPFRLSTATIAAAPTDGSAGTAAHIILSPVTTTGLETTGIFLGLKAPSSGSATAVAAGFTVIPWFLNPVTFAWFAGASAAIAYNQAFTTFDIDAVGIYFQIDAASVSVNGNIDFHVAEQ